jgi:hypothetical protein
MKFNAKKGDRVKMMQEGGKGPGDEAKAKALKSKILTAIKGGASDKEVRKMVKDSGLQSTYEFNWDNVEMKVEMHKLPKKAEKGMKMPGGGKMKYAMYGSKMKKS